MANFMGGSAPAMAAQVAEGMILLSPATLRTFSPADLTSLRTEMERLQRDARGQVCAPDDASANQAKSRRITRLNSAVNVVHNKLAARR